MHLQQLAVRTQVKKQLSVANIKIYNKLNIYNKMGIIRAYGWNDWISVPKNRELYDKNMKEGLRQFKMEKQRRDKLTQSAVLKIKGFNGK